MGTTLRIIFVGEDDSLHRISLARYARLSNRDEAESMPEYAGKRVRCATVFLEVEDRMPLAIVDIQYSILCFDDNGRIDAARDEREMQLASEFLSFSLEDDLPAGVINARQRFLRKQYEHEFKWTPDRDLEMAIRAAIFQGEKKKP